MKIQELNLFNFGKYKNVSVSFDPNVTYLIGPNGAGKTTAGLNGMWFILQGLASKAQDGKEPLIGERFRFIGPSAKTASGELVLDDNGAKITVTRKLNKNGTELSFDAPAGYKLSQQWLNELFNLFLIAPKKFIQLTPVEQARALGIDTREHDEKIKVLKADATEIGRDIKAYGELTPVEPADAQDIEGLKARRDDIRRILNAKYLSNKARNQFLITEREQTINANLLAWEGAKDEERRRVHAANLDRDKLYNKYVQASAAAETLTALGFTDKALGDFIFALALTVPAPEVHNFPPRPADPEPFTLINEVPDSKELVEAEKFIEEAHLANAAAERYEVYARQLDGLNGLRKDLEQNKNAQYMATTARLAYIKSFELPFEGLEVDEEGQLLIDAKPLKEPYFSTGELLIIIPQIIAAQNPELKYVFIQDASLLDPEGLQKLEEALVPKGFQLVFEYVGAAELPGKNSILMKEIVTT